MPTAGNTRFGQHLRRIRVERRLTPAAVEEITRGYPQPIKRSQLARVESGRGFLTFPRIYALSRVYGVSIDRLGDRYGSGLGPQPAPHESAQVSRDELARKVYDLHAAGRVPEALAVCEMLLRRDGDLTPRDERLPADSVRSRLARIECLIHLDRYRQAKDEAERLLGSGPLSKAQLCRCLQSFGICSLRMQRFELARMALDRARAEAGRSEQAARLRANLDLALGNLHAATGRYARSLECYRRAAKKHDRLGNGLEQCRTWINMSSVLIEIGDEARATRLLSRALSAAERGGHARQACFASSNMAVIAFKRGDLSAAETLCVRSNSVARPGKFLRVGFRNCFYLWRIALARGDRVRARAYEFSIRADLSRITEPSAEIEQYLSHPARGES